MASGGMMSGIRCQASIFNGKSFTWKASSIQKNSVYCSDSFQFCGYCCHFVIEYGEKGHLLSIGLYGFPTLCKSSISCNYSLILKNDYGSVCHFETGQIQLAEETIDIAIYKGSLKGYIDHILFSWCENGDCEGSLKGLQLVQEVATNILEQGTQTEVIEILPSSDMRNFAERSTNVKRETFPNAADSSTATSTCTYEENEAFKFLEILSKDLGTFYESQTDPDCVLTVGETKFHVHRSVLAARSTVFGAMFHHDTSESQSGDVDIPDVDAGAFGDILYYVYTGKIRGLSPDTAASMYVVSDKYSLIDFREKCLSFLKSNLTMKNVCDAALLANAHSETELDDKIVQFIEEHLEDIIENDNWEKFSETHYKLANKLLCSACKISKNKLMKKPSP